MLKTPEETMESILHDITWAWYATCLPMDRQDNVPGAVPPEIAAFLTSPRIAALILARYHDGMAIVIEGMREQARRYIVLTERLQRQRSHLSTYERQLAKHEMAEAVEDFFNYQLRSFQLPATVEAMRVQLRAQLPWMYTQFTASKQAQLAELAAWHAQQ